MILFLKFCGILVIMYLFIIDVIEALQQFDNHNTKTDNKEAGKTSRK